MSITGRQYADEALKIYALVPQAGYIWGTKGVLWNEARQKQLERTTDEDRAMGRKYGSKWIGHYVWDCSGLTSGCGDKFGLKYHHGSNSSYLYDCQAKGKLTSSMDLPVGAWVYTGTDKSKPHIGVYTGDGMVTEAAGTRQGVIQTKLHGGKWKYWGLGKGIEFDFVPGKDTPTPGTDHPTLRKGSKGTYVTLLQTQLMNLGYALPKYGADGSFGAETEAAVKAFQENNGLKADGIVGTSTWDALEKNPVKSKLYTVKISHLEKSTAEDLVKQYTDAVMTEE